LVVAHHFVLYLLPVADVALYQDLVDHAEVKAALYNLLQLVFVVRDSASPAAKRIRNPDYDWVADLLCSLERLLHRVDFTALPHRAVALYHRVLEHLPVLGDLDSLYLGAKNSDPIFF